MTMDKVKLPPKPPDTSLWGKQNTLMDVLTDMGLKGSVSQDYDITTRTYHVGFSLTQDSESEYPSHTVIRMFYTLGLVTEEESVYSIMTSQALRNWGGKTIGRTYSIRGQSSGYLKADDGIAAKYLVNIYLPGEIPTPLTSFQFKA